MDRKRALSSILLAISAVLLALSAAAAAAGQEPPPTPADSAAAEPFAGAAALDRQALLAAVAARNPTLEAARRGWQAAAARPRQERALPDPMLSYGAAPASLAGTGLRFGQQIELSQDLPLGSRRRLRGRRAEAEASSAAADYRSTLLDLLRSASLLYDDYRLAVRSLAIEGQHRALLEELQRVATGRYAAGLTPQQDPIQAELEGAKIVHREVELEAQREVIVSRLDALLHLPPGHPLPPPGKEEETLEPRPLDPAALTQAALAQRPEIAEQAARVEAARAALAFAELARRPDLAVRGSYDSMWNEPGYRWMAGVAINLPVRGERLASQRGEAAANLARAQAELAASEDRVRTEVSVAAIELREARHLLEIYASRLLPAARDQVEAARSGFATARGSFLGVIDAERSLRDLELGREQAMADLRRQQAELDRAVGRLPAGLPADLLEPGGPGGAPASVAAPPKLSIPDHQGGSR